MTAPKPPKAPRKPKAPAVPKHVQAELDEFKRMCRDLEIRSVERQGESWVATVSAPKYGDARMLEYALTNESSARYKRIEAIDQHSLEITL